MDKENNNIFDRNEAPKRGKLLISEPFMNDPNFKRTVILLCEHNDEGSVGFVLNRKTELTLTEAMPDITNLNAPLYYGGPVEPNTLHYIHNLGDTIPESVQIGDNLFWGGDFQTLKVLIDNETVQSANIRFFLGYSGWGPEQIIEELNQQSWFVVDGRAADVFCDDEKQLWNQILEELGGEYKQISNYPENPNWN